MIRRQDRAEYALWARWVEQGRVRGKRPKTVRASIPKAWWDAYHAAHPPKKPPPPSTVDLSRARNLLVWATVTDDAITQSLSLPPRWRHLFSADPAYKPSEAQVERVIRAGRDANAWCDCRTTLPVAAKEMVRAYGLSDWYGQGENEGEFETALRAGAAAAIVNLSALNDRQLAMVASGAVIVSNENYRNVTPDVRPDWRNANTGVGSNCGAVYASEREGAIYTSAASQIRNGWFGFHDSWYLEGFLPADWQALRELG